MAIDLTDSKHNYNLSIVIFLIALVFLGWHIGDYLLIDLDEPRYPEAAREMIAAKQYLVPMTDGSFLYEKPILIYWCQILSMKIFGMTEFAARLPSVIAGALTVCVAYLFGRFFNRGLITSLILMTSVEFFIISRLSIADMLLNLWIMSTLALYFLISENLIHKNYAYLMTVCISMGFLTKGPLAIFIPCLVIGSYTVYEHFFTTNTIDKKLAIIKSNYLIVIQSIVVFLLLGCSWYVVAHFVTHGEFTQQFFITENFKRYTSVLSGHHFPWWFYMAVIVIGFMPWSIFIPNYLYQLKTNLLGDQATIRLKFFSLIWILSTLVFFTSSNTKLYNYIFSAFFPLSVLLASWFYEQFDSQRKSILINSIVLTMVSLSVQVLYALGYFQRFIVSESFLQHYITKAVVYQGSSLILSLGLLGIISVWFKLKLKKYFFAFTLLTASLLSFAVESVIMPFANYKVSGIKWFTTQIPPQVRLYRIEIDRPSVSYYFKNPTETIKLNRLIKESNSSKEQFCFLAKLDKLNKIQSTNLQIWKTDDLYVYGCNFPEASSKLQQQ